MPKKTKEQKIAAAYRRQMQHGLPATAPKTPVRNDAEIGNMAIDMDGRKVFLRDVTKSFILIATIIAIEFVVFGLTLKGIIRI